ncbi:MAG: type II secretion system ATPase GspE [Armatimonadota bacterium]|nr:type II secretion system ATPase GspE [Armatimonadota bacterium]MDR7537066.1 type II secretion system ATPase GspE [Armatimonadota bacterium]
MSAPDRSSGEGALRTLKEAVGLPRDSSTLERAFLYAEARQAARVGRWAAARDLLLRLLELDPEEPWIYWDLAAAHRALDARHEAGQAYLTAADKHLARGETDQVLLAYQQAAAVAPNDPQIQAKLGDPAAPAAPPAAARLTEAGGPRPETAEPPPGPPGAPEGGGRPDRAPRRRRQRETLGQALVQLGIITRDQLSEALEIQARTGERLGQVLRDIGAITDADLARGMARQWGYPYVVLGERALNAEVVKLIPHPLAARHKCVAVDRRGNRLVVALADPLNVIALDDIRLVTGLEVDPAVATEEDIAQALARSYQITDTLIERALRDSVPDYQVEAGEEDPSVEQLRSLVEEAPVVKLVNLVIDEAVKQGASDIHIEPHRGGIWVRFRVDGVLRDVMNPPKNLKAALVSRVKIMADMDISERRRPQDGRIHLITEGRGVDLRVSTLPTMFGEKVVMRILDQSQALIGLGRLGFHSDTLRQWESAISKPHGMLLVTGPTGSGKTTTLYATLSKLNTPDKNIITVEDPVEYQLARINQVQVNPKAGLTFANGLRSILRQDPDIVMVGEIRDRETAEIAVQAALTGHLVLSTLHTNDAAGAITRLIDMGVEAFLISSSVIAVLAQRLARAICPRCKVGYAPPPDALGRLGAERIDSEVVFYRGQGCDYCRGTGYKGRIGIFELLTVTDPIRELVVRRAPSTEIKAQAIREGMRTLRDDGLEKVLAGISTIDEILRVVYVQD